MKTCEFKKYIASYLDGELSGEKFGAFEAHLNVCPACREEVEQYRELLGGLHGMEEKEVPPMLSERLHAALAHEIMNGQRAAKKRKAWPWVLSTASAAVVIGAVGLAALLGANQSPMAHRPANQAAGTGGLPTAAATADKGPELMAAATAAPAAPQAPMPAPTKAPAAAAATEAPASLTAKSTSKDVQIANPWKEVTPKEAASTLGGTFYNITTLSQDYQQYALMVNTSDVVKDGSMPVAWVRFKKGNEDVSLQMSIGGTLSPDELKGTKVTVNGADAYFISHEDGTTQIAWESNGIIFLISTSTPWSQEDLITLAEGVQAAK